MSNGLEKAFSQKKVLITGHTGFKGSWLTMWLKLLGAHVIGYSLKAPTHPNLFEIAGLEGEITHTIGDIRDLSKLSSTIRIHKPQIIFHLAAQPIVLHSFEDPIGTFTSNVMGTANLLEACRDLEFIQAIVVITTDKCYENKEWEWGYRENDPLGGHDPYSASKAMAEIATNAYRSSFFSKGAKIATARAGNVIGGGDFSPFRLMPDTMQALINKTPVRIRNPHSTRPWMHVLDPLHGYLQLAKKLMEHGQEFAESWNFGPREHAAISTGQMVERAIALFGDGNWVHTGDPHAYPEMRTLQLNSDKAANRLKWFAAYDWHESLEATVNWFKAYDRYRENPNDQDMRDFCNTQIFAFMEKYRLRESTQETADLSRFEYLPK